MAEPIQKLLDPRVITYLVVDLETTCWLESERAVLKYKQPEIIEIGATLTGAGSLSDWRSFVRPRVNTQLSRFCRDLTGISQDRIDEAEELPEVVSEWVTWVARFQPVIFASWGDFDYNVLRREWTDHDLGVMPFSMHLNLKRHFALLTGQEERGLADACTSLYIKFEGAQHEALNDAKMATAVLLRMWGMENGQ